MTNKADKLKKIIGRDLEVDNNTLTIVRYNVNDLEEYCRPFDEIYQGKDRINKVTVLCGGIEKDFNDAVEKDIFEYIYKVVDDGRYSLRKRYKKLEEIFDVRYIYKDYYIENDSIDDCYVEENDYSEEDSEEEYLIEEDSEGYCTD